MIPDFIEIGHIAKLHGFKGEVSIYLDVTDPQYYFESPHFLVEMNGVPTPFLVEWIKPKNKGFITVKFEGISSEEDARILLKKRVIMPEAMLPELDEHTFYDFEVIGFSVEDQERGPIGTVVEVIDHPSNPLLSIDFNGKEILIPLNLDLSKRVDRTSKTIYLSCPEGLLSIYLD